MSERLGLVVSGSLDTGIKVRLDSSASVEEMTVGRFVTIEGEKHRFFGMITDISLGVINDQIIQTPPNDTFIAQVLTDASTYGMLDVLPMLTIGNVAGHEEPQPVKTVPRHFSPVKLASDTDIESVFGKEDEKRFWIGNPLDMETKLCLNLEEFVKRSNGIFGKSGTGKTFLTRIILIGILQSKAVNLIFDMQNEYGYTGTKEGSGTVKGLKQLFETKVAVFSLDEENSSRRRTKPDAIVKIGYDDIEPEDIVIMRQTLRLTEWAVTAIYPLSQAFGKKWIQRTIEATSETIPEPIKVHENTLQNLQRGLQSLNSLPFIQEQQSAGKTADDILRYLERGTNVVLEFGKHQNIATYMFVANMLSRRIYTSYQKRMENAMASAEESTKPHPLVITIEEAHKFLNSEVADQTIFGTIAREMRKYNVTLLVIDQRPSGISEEVMSQLGTKISCSLDNERDIDSVLAGVSGKKELKGVLSKLASKQQALIFGHAVPMPVSFQVREYGSAKSYDQFKSTNKSKTKSQAEEDAENQIIWD